MSGWRQSVIYNRNWQFFSDGIYAIIAFVRRNTKRTKMISSRHNSVHRSLASRSGGGHLIYFLYPWRLIAIYLSISLFYLILFLPPSGNTYFHISKGIMYWTLTSLENLAYLENHLWVTCKSSFYTDQKNVFDFLLKDSSACTGHAMQETVMSAVLGKREWLFVNPSLRSHQCWLRIQDEQWAVKGDARRGGAAWRPLSRCLHRSQRRLCSLWSVSAAFQSCETESFASGNDHVHVTNTIRKKVKKIRATKMSISIFFLWIFFLYWKNKIAIKNIDRAGNKFLNTKVKNA